MLPWKRNLYVICVGQFLTMVGMSAVVPFLPLYLRDLGVTTYAETARWSGYVFSAPFIMSFFVQPYWGVLGDRYGKKFMTLRAVYGLSISLVLIGLSQNAGQLLFFRILQGLLSGFYPAALALAASSAPKEKTGYAMGMVQSSNTSGNIIGPLIGGVLAEWFGYSMVFILVGIGTGITAVFIHVYIKETDRTDDKHEYFSFKENLKFTFNTKAILTAGVIIVLTAFGFAIIRPVFVLYVETFRISQNMLASTTGALFSVLGIGSAFSSFWFVRKIPLNQINKFLALSTLTMAVMYAFGYYVQNIYLLFPITAIIGFAFGLIFPLLFSYIMQYTEQERKGGVMGIASSWQTLGNMTGPVSAGYLTAHFGVRNCFILAAGLFFAIAGLSYKMLSKWKKSDGEVTD